MSKFELCKTPIHPGEVANLALTLPSQYACSPLYMPIKVIRGKKPGPTVLVLSVLKGNELNGLEICNRLINSLSANEISGTVIAIPVVNVYGLTHYPKLSPTGSDLNTCFPGNEHGSWGERVAHLLTHEVLKKADYCIELQTGGLDHNILPQVYCNFENAQAKKLAKVFKTPVITNVNISSNSLRETTEQLGIPLLVYQAGEAMRFDENAISLGLDGVKNVLRAIDILPKAPDEEFKPIFSQDEEWFLAHQGGILHTYVSLGQVIEKNEVIGHLSDPFGADEKTEIRAKDKGVVVGINTAPLIHEGLPIFKIVSFIDYDRAENTIETWDKSQPDSYLT